MPELRTAPPERMHRRMTHPTPIVIPCGICGRPTRYLGTKRCDRCWELESRINADPHLARRILAALDTEDDREDRNHRQAIEDASGEHGQG